MGVFAPPYKQRGVLVQRWPLFLWVALWVALWQGKRGCLERVKMLSQFGPSFAVFPVGHGPTLARRVWVLPNLWRVLPLEPLAHVPATRASPFVHLLAAIADCVWPGHHHAALWTLSLVWP